MGMYTHFVLNANLIKDTPNDVIGTLLWLSYQTEICPIQKRHKLYGLERMGAVMCGDSCSFDGDTNYSFHFDEIQQEWAITINSNIKNYNMEYQKFLEYIQPYITDSYEGKKFLGFMRYEEREEPTLIYNTKNGIEYKEIGGEN